MRELALRIATRVAGCAALSWLAWRYGGVVAMCSSLALFGIALARPLLDLASAARHQIRSAVWAPLEGRHASFRGQPVQVLEDEAHRRWIRAADVKRIVGYTTGDSALALTYPGGWQLMGSPAEPHFSEEALRTHLRRQTTPIALKFGHWVEREIAFPARRKRELLGIPSAGTAAADE